MAYVSWKLPKTIARCRIYLSKCQWSTVAWKSAVKFWGYARLLRATETNSNKKTAIDRCMCPISTIGNWKAAKRRFLNKSWTLLRTEKRCKIRVRWRSEFGWPAKFISRDLTLMKPIRCTLTLSKLVFISIRINLILPQSTIRAYNSWSINFRYLWKTPSQI